MCTSGVCTCAGDSLVYDKSTNQCTQRKLSEKCNSDINCQLLDGASCVDGKCKCPPGKSCEEKCKLNKTCDSSFDCDSVIDGWICSDEGVQVCNLSYVQVGDYSCRPRTKDDSCDGLIFDTRTLLCVDRKIGDACNDDSECGLINNATCSGTCTCISPYIFPILDNTTCSRCQLEAYIYDDSLNTCIQRVLGDPCKADSQCELAFNNSVCEENQCACPDGYARDTQINTCIFCALGQYCSAYANCTVNIPYSFCNGSNLTCLPLAVQDDGSLFCRLRTVNDSCSTEYECSGLVNGTCSSGTCQCKEDALIYNNETIQCNAKKLRDPCRTESDCRFVNNATCTTGKCTCVKPYSNMDDVVCQPCALGSSCSKEVDCSIDIPYSICDTNVLRCTARADQEGEKCRLKRFLDSCSSTSQCSHLDKGDCFGSKCECIPGHILDQSSSCIESKLYDSCPLGVRNCPLNSASVCRQGICACPPEYKNSSDVTCVIREFGDDCDEGSDSTSTCGGYTGGSCEEGKCSCSKNYKLSPSKSSCLPRQVDDPCSNTSDCSLINGNGVCIDNICKCPENFIENVKTKNCERHVYGSPCTNIPDTYTAPPCGFTGGMCDDKNCICKTSHIRKEDGCKPLKLNSPCSSDCDSTLGLECRDAVCKCLPGYEAKDGVCTSIIGTACTVDGDCNSNTNGGFSCINSSCACAVGFFKNDLVGHVHVLFRLNFSRPECPYPHMYIRTSYRLTVIDLSIQIQQVQPGTAIDRYIKNRIGEV